MPKKVPHKIQPVDRKPILPKTVTGEIMLSGRLGNDTKPASKKELLKKSLCSISIYLDKIETAQQGVDFDKFLEHLPNFSELIKLLNLTAISLHKMGDDDVKSGEPDSFERQLEIIRGVIKQSENKIKE